MNRVKNKQKFFFLHLVSGPHANNKKNCGMGDFGFLHVQTGVRGPPFGVRQYLLSLSFADKNASGSEAEHIC